ncbi:MAG TPA: SPOR domain-containing protein [Gemmatimonadales bacterium]|nr:SPOR domain-containing protein [Gemmatimonadales bacterium]
MAALALLVGACGGGQSAPRGHLPEPPRTAPAASVLRVPQNGGLARLYRIPGLTESSWKASDKLPALKRLVGGDLEQRLVFGLDAKNNLIGLDLESRRVRIFLPQVRQAAIGPDGAVYAVDTSSTVTQFVRRTPLRFRPKLAIAPRALYGTMNGSLIAIPAADRAEAVTLGPDQAQARANLPAGDARATFLGDMVAIATDSGVVLYEPQAKRPVRTFGVAKAHAVAFSPSGHRLYVARGKNDIAVLDRFSGDELSTFKLPGTARELRSDFFGGWLLARPVVGDSVWVIDIGAGRVAGTVPARWSSDLPAVAGQRTLLIRAGDDVRALDLSTKGFPVSGTVAGGAGDEWLPLAWLPPAEHEATVAAADSAAVDSTAAAGGASVYLQVSSSQNPSWAQELANKLKAAGLPASVLRPNKGDEGYRVVLGPYATREQAEATGKGLGMPSFVITPQDQPARAQ